MNETPILTKLQGKLKALKRYRQSIKEQAEAEGGREAERWAMVGYIIAIDRVQGEIGLLKKEAMA